MVKQRAPLSFRRPIRFLRAAAPFVLLAGGAWFYTQHGGWQDQPRTRVSQATTIPLPEAVPFRSVIDYDAFDRRISTLMAKKDMTGLAVAVVEDGKLAFVRGYGVTSQKTLQPVTEHTVFRWASLSKGVAATMAAKLAADGRLDLDRTIASYGTSLRLPGHAEQQAKVADILSHRLGLARNAYDGRLESGVDPVEIRHELGALTPICPPGTCHSYQNVAYDTIAEIIARATKHSYADMVRTQLFEPLHMTGASIGMADLTCARSWARPYRNGYPVKLSDAYYRVPAAAGVNSNILDMARWMEAQMGKEPEVLTPAVLKELHAGRVNTRAPYGPTALGRALHDATYGLGWRSFTYAGHRLVGHSGAVAGYRSTMMFDPATRTGIAMLWNSESSRPFRAQLELLDLYYGRPFYNWMELDTLPEAPSPSSIPLKVATNANTAKPALAKP